MKIAIYFIYCLFLFGTTTTFAQIQINIDDYPVAGVQYQIATDTSNQIVMTLGGSESQSWDYSMFNQDILRIDSFLTTDQLPDTALFKNSDLIYRIGGVVDNFLETNDQGVYLVGRSVNVLGQSFETPLSPAQLYLKNPTSFDDSLNDVSSFNLPIALADFPALDSIIQDLLPVPLTVDSIRVLFETEMQMKVDAWGNCDLPQGKYDVLRTKALMINTSSLEVHSYILGIPFWQNVQELGIEIPGFGIDSSIQYNFWAKNHHVPVVSVTTNLNGEVTTINFVTGGTTSTTPIRIIDQSISPNPTNGRFSIQIPKSGASNQNMVIEVVNRSGQLLKRKIVSSLGDHRIEMNCQDFVSGLYYVRVQDGENYWIGKVFIMKD